ncbi:uncharacterized protein BDV14DRAFT_200506 [Aspergillus stella-maris]|uniref:uncharacterized protein n=1 Tax=Aspergillus stella-maris TaxID=1810926 RepID=UPI003CCE0ACA
MRGTSQDPKGLTYDLDPDGDVTLNVFHVPADLPAQLEDLTPDVFSSTVAPFTQKKAPSNKNGAQKKRNYIVLRASSKHLSLACPYFKRMFKSGFKESNQFRSDGAIELSIEQNNGLAFLMLMPVIHCQTALVPRVIPPAMLTEIAILVDYYECHGAVQVFSDMWIAANEDQSTKLLSKALHWDSSSMARSSSLYELDPDGDVTLFVYNVPDDLPAEMAALSPHILAGIRIKEEPESDSEKTEKRSKFELESRPSSNVAAPTISASRTPDTSSSTSGEENVYIPWSQSPVPRPNHQAVLPSSEEVEPQDAPAVPRDPAPSDHPANASDPAQENARPSTNAEEPALSENLDHQATVAPQSDTDTTAEPGEPHIVLRVSSKHLALASPHFKRMFKSQFREGTVLRSTGGLELPIRQPNGVAFLLLMIVIHCPTRHVPREITKGMLTDIAVLVDYYECHAAVEFFSDLWISAIENNKEYNAHEFQDWVLISWVFSKPGIFRNSTRNLVETCDGVIASDMLPFPSDLIEELNLAREEMIGTIINELHVLHNELLKGSACNFSDSGKSEICSYVVLGSIPGSSSLEPLGEMRHDEISCVW